MKSRVFSTYVPSEAIRAESELFATDMRLLLQLLREEYLMHPQRAYVDSPESDSSQPG